MFSRDKYVSRMHICVKKAVAKDLSEKYLNAALSKHFHVRLLLLKRRYIGYRNTMYTLYR